MSVDRDPAQETLRVVDKMVLVREGTLKGSSKARAEPSSSLETPWNPPQAMAAPA